MHRPTRPAAVAIAVIGACLPGLRPAAAQPAAAAAAPPSASSPAAVAVPVAAPVAAARPLTQADYDRWNSAVTPTLSRDGRWLAYTRAPQVGDGELVVRSTSAATEYRVTRGFVGRPELRPNADSGWSAPAPAFSADGRVVAALTYATRDEFEAARRAKRREPRASLAVVTLATGAVRTVPNVKSFAVPRAGGGWLAYLLEPADTSARSARDSAGRDTTAGAGGGSAATPGGAPRPVADSATRGRRRDYGSTLVLVDLATGAETRVEDVVSYAFGDSARHLAYAVASRTPSRDGAYVRALGAAGTPAGGEVALRTGRGDYRALTFDRAGRQLAFVTNAAEFGRPKARYALVHARLDRLTPRGGAPEVRTAVAVDAAVANGEPGLVVSDRGLSFVRDGSALVFGLAPAPLDSVPADSLADKAVLDLWHYQDARLQPQQRVEAQRDRGRPYTAVYHPADGRAVRLGTDTLARVTVSDDGRTALAQADLPYALSQLWGEGGSDLYVLDARTGARTLVARRVPFPGALSPGGRYVTWFAEGRWRAYDVAARATSDLTGALRGVRFDRETWDTPGEPEPWGTAGYTTGERDLLVYARYDVWAVDPSGRRAPRVVTDSAGVRNALVFRLARTGDERTVDAGAPLLLTAFDDRTKAAGFYRDRVDGGGAPERVVMADARFGAPLKARDADVFAVTRQSFTDAPDVWAGPRLDALARLTDVNPQRGEYAWGSAELVHWRSLDGLPLDGILYKPAGFDPRRRYPMVVYFYEQLADNLHQYHAPFGRNTINPTVYASNGYVVFFPDIAYANGYPGQSALKSIMPGVQAVAARGFVDERRVGIAGQSWGGYQGAYLITQTPYFRAAFLGAPVANMTSAYGGIRWESGLARAFQYEKGQSRIGRSPWDALPRYLENSPLFAVDRVTTPMLIMSNDADGAVPWYQGIELFVGARRFGKEAYLLNYNGDGHNPRKRANQLDVDRRMQQFFAHHLKGEPAPAWMREGVPYARKGRDQLAPAATVAGGAPAAETPNAEPGAGRAAGQGPAARPGGSAP